MSVYLASLTSFALYFVASVGLGGAFMLVYTWITPYAEAKLIADGNRAAAISLVGAGLGFVIPLASAIAHSLDIIDMVLWGVVAMTVQLALYLLVRVAVPGLVAAINADRGSVAIALAGLSLGVGLLNAACMTF